MSKQIDTPFVGYEFTEQEVPLARIFTELQEQHIRTELAVAATGRATMTLDPTNIYASFGALEYERGKIEALSALLATSQNEKDHLAAELQSALDLQQPLTTNNSST
jgi:hypothetical protein